MNQNNRRAHLRLSSRSSAAPVARLAYAYQEFPFQPQSAQSEQFKPEQRQANLAAPQQTQQLGAAFQHFPSGNDLLFSVGHQNPIYDYSAGQQHDQARLDYVYQYQNMQPELSTPAQSVRTPAHRSPVRAQRLPAHMSPSLQSVGQHSPHQQGSMTPALQVSQTMPQSVGSVLGVPQGVHVSPQEALHRHLHQDHQLSIAHSMSPAMAAGISPSIPHGSPALQRGAAMISAESHQNIASLTGNTTHEYIKEEELSHGYGTSNLGSSQMSSSDLHRAAELGSRKRPRVESADDSDKKLRSLTSTAAELPLHELAAKIKMTESVDADSTSDPLLLSLIKSKKAKLDMPLQVFAMSWVQHLCEPSHTSVVPRNRIYARYVQLCANFNLNPLAPANFGKVLRILFPNLKTRRLGMRGKSKYHYCGIKLVGDQTQEGSPMSTYSSFGLDSPQSLNPHTPPFACSPSVSNMLGTPFSSIQVNEHFQVVDLKYVPSLFSAIEMSMGADTMNQPLNIPSIYPYIQKEQDVDYDIADTLYSLYKVHCTSLFELLRYMQVDKMLGMFAPFTAILTTPVFKLFTAESTFEWFKDCDLVMYRSMLKMLTRLHLQSVPDEIIQPLKEVARNYITKLSESFGNKFPKQFIMVKLGVARQFILILKRLLKCIETGVSASKILTNANEKSIMLNDWLQLDMHEIVMREVPCALDNSETLIEILDTNLVKLFEDNSQTELPVLKPYALFLFDLPSKFSKLNPWLFSLVCSNLLTTCLREMSLSGARSFGSWWVVRCWVDEYLSWCLELGGFLYEEFRTEFEVQVKTEDFERPVSSNVSANLSTGGQEKTTYVDLLDGLHGDLRSFNSESDWL